MSARCTSIGMSSRTGPGRPPAASAKARASIARHLFGLVTRHAAFVTGSAIGTMSVSWNPSCRIGALALLLVAVDLAR